MEHQRARKVGYAWSEVEAQELLYEPESENEDDTGDYDLSRLDRTVARPLD